MIRLKANSSKNILNCEQPKAFHNSNFHTLALALALVLAIALAIALVLALALVLAIALAIALVLALAPALVLALALALTHFILSELYFGNVMAHNLINLQ